MATIERKDAMAKISKQLKKEQRILRLRRFTSNYGLMAGTAVFLLFLILAAVGPLLTGQDPYGMNVVDRLQPPGASHLLGTDEFGRDLLTRILYGARVSIGIGLVVALLSSCMGLLIGLYASYYKALDHLLMRICDGLVAIPGILMAIALMAALGASSVNVIIALTVVFTPNIARTVRSTALVAREMTYVEAMRAQGASDTRIIWLHIAPNTLSPLLVQATFVFA